MIGIIAACACAGIIIGVTTLTGLGLNVTHIILDVAGNNLYLTLLLTMVAALILGMGLPTTATYIIVVVLLAPAIVTAGPSIPLIAAHLFIFYFGIVADDTPPVGVAAYAAAGVANSDPFKTCIEGFKLDFRIIYPALHLCFLISAPFDQHYGLGSCFDKWYGHFRYVCPLGSPGWLLPSES